MLSIDRTRSTQLPKPFQEPKVLRPRVYDFYRLAVEVHPVLSLVPQMKFSGNRPAIETVIHCKLGLLLFLGNDFVNKALPDCRAAAQRISDRIDQQFIKLSGEPWDDSLQAGSVEGLLRDVRSLETLLETGLGNLSITCCDDDQLGNLSSNKLIKGAHKGYSTLTQSHLMQQCLDEIDEAGRCLAYERPTAAGFHILRAVEIAVKDYLCKIPGFVMPPLNRQNWGEYIKLLKESGASKEVTDTLQGVKDNHRNPLMHPDDSLDMHAAVSLFSVCQSVVELLVGDLKQRNLI
jgi:hypothetical protein